MHLHSEAPVVGGSRKPALRKLHAKVDVDQEKGGEKQCIHLFMMGVFFDCHACAEDPVSSSSIKMSVSIAADSEIPTEYVEFNCEKY